MAITRTLVGTAIRAQNAANPVEITLTQAVPAGKVLVVAAFSTSSPVLTGVTDDKSNSYTALTVTTIGQGNGYWVHAPVTTGLASGDKIYVGFSGAASRRFAIAVMLDGAAVSYIDAQGSPAQTGTGTAPVVNTGPQAEAGEAVLAWFFVTSPLATIFEDGDWDFVGETAPADNRIFHVAAKDMATTAADTYEPTLNSSRDWSANWLAIKAASAPSGHTLTAAAGALAVSGKAAIAKATRRLPIVARSFTLARINTAIRKGFRVRADLRSYGLAGIAARVARGLKLRVSVQAFNLTGKTATLIRTVAGRTITAVAAALTVTRQPAGMRVGRKLRAAPEPFVWSRLAAGLRWARRLVASGASFVLAGRPVAWGWVHVLSPAPAPLAVTGGEAVLRYSGVQSWQPVPGHPESWDPQPGTGETWTPADQTEETWS